MPGLMHLVSLQQAAGVEAHFTEFVRAARVQHPDWSHGWLDTAGGMHPHFAGALARDLSCTVSAKRRWGVKLPSKPDALRAWHVRRELAAARTDVLLVWNRTARVGFAVDAIGPERCVHWEHGAAWHDGREAERRRYLARVPRAIANSQASARVLELVWSYAGEVHVCRNALRPSLVPAAPAARRYPVGAIKLGVVARLFPVKGVALAIHALKALLDRTFDARLEIAGAGPELARLQALARSLGVAERVRFHGAVRDMAEFYTSIDCLLHAPLTEAFGLVAIEAAARGCPVIAAAVDGLPEAVADGVSGYCVTPTLALDTYVQLGGDVAEMPSRVYDPAHDALAPPRAVDPAALAAAVERMFADGRTYEALSAAASAHVLGLPTFAAHVRDVMSVVAEAAQRE